MSVCGSRNSTEGGQIRPRTAGLSILATLAIIQWYILFSPDGGRGEMDPWLQEGDTLAQVRATTAKGVPALLASGQPLLLLVFHPECGHCQDVVPIWRDWVQETEPEIRLVAATSARLEAASVFLSTHSWESELWILENQDGTPGKRPVTGRTPWIFLLDGDGVILSEGHGQRIEELGRQWPDILRLRWTGS